MAIPFQLPTEEDTARLQAQLENLLVEMFDVLNQLAPNQSPALLHQQAALPPVGPAIRAPAMQSFVSGHKNRAAPATTATNSTASATQRQSWKQLGAELRVLADQFSNKHKQSSSVLQCSNPGRQSRSSSESSSKLRHRIFSLLLPKTLSCSAAIILVGLRLLKHRFA